MRAQQINLIVTCWSAGSAPGAIDGEIGGAAPCRVPPAGAALRRHTDTSPRPTPVPYSLESHASRLWQRKLLRDGGSGKVLLTARASTVRQRRRWTIFDGKGRVAMDVCISRIWWHRKAHGEGAYFSQKSEGVYIPVVVLTTLVFKPADVGLA